MIKSNSRVARPWPCPTTKLLLAVILLLDPCLWALLFAAARASLESTFGKGSFSSQSPLQCTCSFSSKMVCFCSASLILVSNRRYVIFLARDFKIGGRQKHVWDRILREVAGALEHIHSCEYIHNDLNNVVSEQREAQPSPVIIDFGRAWWQKKLKYQWRKQNTSEATFPTSLRNSEMAQQLLPWAAMSIPWLLWSNLCLKFWMLN